MNELQWFEQAKNCLEKGDYPQGIAYFSRCIEENPDDLNYYWYLGLVYVLNNEEEQANDIWMSRLLGNSSSNSGIEQLIKILEINIRYHLNQKEINFEVVSKILPLLSDLNEDFYNTPLYFEISTIIEFSKKEALTLAFSKKLSEAKSIYENILLLSPDDADILYQLGIVYFELNDYEESQKKVIAAIVQNPDSSIYYDGLGSILEKTQQFNQAIQAYSTAIEKDLKNSESYIKLANLLRKLGLVQEAKTIYQQALDNQIEHFAIYMNYANLLMADEQYEAAVDLYKKSIKIKNNYADIYYNLALALEKLDKQTESLLYQGKNAYHEGRFDQAFEYFEQYRLSDQVDLDFYNELGEYYQSRRMYRELIPIAEQGIKKYPESIRQRIYIIFSYRQLNQSEESLRYADESMIFFEKEKEKSWAFEVYKQGILPIICDTENQINDLRKKYLENLNNLIEKIERLNYLITEKKIEDTIQKNLAMFVLKSRTNYYLHFHNKNDLEIQIKYGIFVSKVMQHFCPDWMQPLNTLDLSSQNKIRVGYLCHRTHSLGSLFLGWIKYRNQSLFEIYFYDIGSVINPETESTRLYSDYYYHIPNNIEQVAQQIHDDNLHVLVFLDVGIEPDMSCLSVLRLAPIQCNTWGHPITSGSPQIDYFLGSDAMEPDNAQEHYSETLIRLPNLGIHLPKPELSNKLKARSEFGFNEEDILYVSCQMTAKYLPQHDYLFCEIVKQVPNGKIVFSEAYESPEVNQKFKARLKQKFESYGLNFEMYCLFTPRVSPVDYLNKLCLADVFLDTIGWSGGLTSVDAIACGLPIVTIPGEFMRGRQSYGMLKIIGVTETIAQNEAEYIDIAVRLGKDSQWRKAIKEKIQQRNNLLFGDSQPLKKLEEFYQTLVDS
jgi:predicted O-linked N-acetylglucosamine transferase (SPINDLY family)